MSFLTAILKAAGPMIPRHWVERTVREYVNRRFSSFGAMTALQLDSANHRATLELDLKGEAQPVRITIGRYESTTANGKTFIEIQEITTSREWLTLLAGQLTKGRKFEVPEALAGIL